MKRCSRCKNLKDKKEFFRNSKTSDGLTSWCKYCYGEGRRKYKRKYCKDNSEILTARMVKWIKDNKKRYLKYQREYHRKHYARV